MKDRLPYMPFFVADYMGSTDVRLMSLAERGAYTHLLFMNWQEGRLQKDPKKLAKLLDCSPEEFEEVWEAIQHKFETDSKGRIYNKRVEEIRKQSIDRSKKLSRAGKKGGESTQARLKPGFKAGSSTRC